MGNKTLKILVTEDEVLVAYMIKEMLQDFGYANVVLANDYNTSLRNLKYQNIELAILDINIEGNNEGLELAKYCKQNLIPFFYITSYTDKPTLDEALKTTPGAYLVKPFLESNLYTALEITLKGVNNSAEEKVQFKEGNGLVNINPQEIIYLKSENIYVQIVTKYRQYLIRGSLNNVVSKLPKDLFHKVHRSYVVNHKHISAYRNTFLEMNGAEIPLSRSYKQSIKELLQF